MEASAGTGKTYAIGSLVLRLLLEPGSGGLEPPTIDRVLVVTFTRAATTELRDRVRARMVGALAALDSEPPGSKAGDDPAFSTWLTRMSEPDSRPVRDRLQRALRDFDDAAIFTIHGFCQRMLHEFAFESRVDFTADQVADETTLVNTAIHDFWALLAYGAPSVAIAWLSGPGRLDVGVLEKLGRVLAAAPHLERVPPRPETADGPDDLAALQDRYDAAWAKAMDAWRAGGPEALEVIARAADERVLNGTRYKAVTIRGMWPRQLTALFDRPPAWPDDGIASLVKKLGKVPDSANKGKTPPTHPFVDACADLLEALDAIEADLVRWGLTVRHDLGAWLAVELPERKRLARQQSYNDLLHQFHGALQGGSSAAARLAARVRGRFRAALIDEFQDTDRVQYEIFQTIFAPDGACDGPPGPRHSPPPAHPLLLVGDPKQAIYAFRGADVFAYLAAVQRLSPEQRHTLTENFRSDRSLVEALGALWSGVPRPFLFESIGFGRVGAHHADRVLPAGPALELAYIPAEVADRDSAGKPVPVERGRRAAARAAATAIDRLLADPPYVPDVERGDGTTRPAEAKDVAVLVRTNREARRMQRTLRAHGVPSVLWSEASVLDQPEAQEMRRLLAAILDPADGRRMRSALVTAVLGLDAGDLIALAEDEAAWDSWVESFREWQHLWRSSGLLPAVRKMLDERKAAAILLAMSDGERRLTNVMHLAELLHGAAFDMAMGPEALAAWFEQVLIDPELRKRALGDTAQLRLESDASAVRVVTVHKSKGLEYPFVYCPFLWSGLRSRKDPALAFHDLDGDGRERLDIGAVPGSTSETAARLESLSEDLRLLYVAMTRGRHRCWVAWGPMNGAQSGALAYLLCNDSVAESVPTVDSPERLDAWREAVESAAKRDIESAAAAGRPEDDPLWSRLGQLARLHPALIRARRLTPPDVRALAPGHEPSVARERETAADPVDRAPGAREITHRPWQQLHRSSFTALSRGEREVWVADPADGVDHDALPTWSEEEDANLAPAAPSGRVPLADLQAGARLGTGLHALLDGLDFARPDRWAARAESLADRRALPREAVEPLVAALGVILGTMLGEGELAFRLSEIARADRVDEMQYVLPVAVEADQWRFVARGRQDGASLERPRVGVRDLAAALAAHPGGAVPADYPTRLAKLPAWPFAGWLSGSLDLVFRRTGPDGQSRWFLLDWKSNRLGTEWSDYARDRLVTVMAQHHYLLQAHLYAVALHRHLRLRQPGYDYERHFGGVLYLFVRGMRSDVPGSGVLFDRMPEARMAALDDLMTRGRP